MLADINNSSSGVNYRLFKQDIGFEEYLTLPDVHRITLCKFRCGNCKASSNNSRGLDFGDKLCTLCNSGKLCDEFHLILECPALALVRKELLPNYYTRRPNILKFNKLFNTKNKKLLCAICKFVKHITSIL